MGENLYTPGCIRTFNGKYINPCEPNPDLIDIEDIAHALSMQPRFGGHLPVFYSVAEHCIQTAFLVSDEHKLAALLHDASEAYLIDVPRPVKEQLSNYKAIEDRLMEVIAKKFGFQWPLHESVKAADECRLNSEWHEYMLQDTGRWTGPLRSYEAKQLFLTSFIKYADQEKQTK